MDKKEIVWTDADLDGACSYLALTWLLGRPIPHNITTTKNFGDNFSAWAKKVNINDYIIYILDLDVANFIDLIDLPNVVIIDHHETHFNAKDKYKNATVHIDLRTSCAKQVMCVFKDRVHQLTKPQVTLLVYADDYDSYQLKHQNSYNLNVVYWSYTGDRLGKFVKSFENGFHGFDQYQKNFIILHKKRISKLKEELRFFKGKVEANGKEYDVIATFADFGINEIADYILEKSKAHIAIIVNEKTGTVSFRKNDESDFNVARLAEDLCEGGGGHEYAAGGKMSPKFIEFCKTLHEVL